MFEHDWSGWMLAAQNDRERAALSVVRTLTPKGVRALSFTGPTGPFVAVVDVTGKRAFLEYP